MKIGGSRDLRRHKFKDLDVKSYLYYLVSVTTNFESRGYQVKSLRLVTFIAAFMSLNNPTLCISVTY